MKKTQTKNNKKTQNGKKKEKKIYTHTPSRPFSFELLVLTEFCLDTISVDEIKTYHYVL